MELFDIYNIYYIMVRRFMLNQVRDPWAAEDPVQEFFLRTISTARN